MYYAVRAGREPGIYTTWDDCKRNIQGFTCAVFKKFETLEAAQLFMQAQAEAATPAQIDRTRPFAFIDGSYSTTQGAYSYGGFIVYDGKTEAVQGIGSSPDFLPYRNISGEIRGALEIYRKAISNGLRDITLFYDYTGICEWASGAWKANTNLAQLYKRYYDEYSKQLRVTFYHTAGHTGITGNEVADLLAKQALDKHLTKKQTAMLEQFRAGNLDPLQEIIEAGCNS